MLQPRASVVDDVDLRLVVPGDQGLLLTPTLRYEVSDPYRLIMPSGVLDSSAATYTALDDRRVRINGGTWTPSEQYTVKLEGAAPHLVIVRLGSAGLCRHRPGR